MLFRSARGIRTVILSGDNDSVVARVAQELGVDQARGGVLPEDKLQEIARLRREGQVVAMIGDGINDAPALAAADVGIAMGLGGADAAIETADVALMSDDLATLPYAVKLARTAMANIRLNVGLALGMKLAFVALAAAGSATLWMAVLADTGASLLVTANGLRLLNVRR